MAPRFLLTREAGDSDGRGAADPRNGGDRLHRNAFGGKLAEEGRPTRCLVRGSSLKVARDHLSRFGAELVCGDLTDSGSLGAATEGVTTVFHLGGGGTVQMTSMDDYLRINVDATRNLLDAASDDPKRHAAKLVRRLASHRVCLTLEEVEAAEHSRHLHHSPGAVVR